ncbi:hypothetical protein INT44_002659 [Umbelopsis vinacea]|uniref:Uncharacterized protein n=1 Tax=Umbelopsis vinacea TaxID=44442 RepID=A0A8H7UAL4_9FUNG|nr:hypothetical protein INT44_002659 [Umbelopsis vinacea]
MGIQYKENSQYSPISKDCLDNAKKEYTLQMRMWTARQINATKGSAGGYPDRSMQSKVKNPNMKSCAVEAT